MSPLLVLGIALFSAAIATVAAVIVLALISSLLRDWKLSAHVVDEDELRKAGL